MDKNPDLTKQLEDKLQKLNDIIEATNLGTWEWNLQTDEFQSNGKWIEMIGYTHEELQPITTQKWAKFVHPEDLHLSNEIIEKHLKDGQNFYHSEIRMRHKEGKWIWIETKGKIIQRDNGGEPIKMFGIHINITSRKEAEEIIKENEKRFFLALDETKAGLWDYDMIDKKIFISPMWKEILGYQDNELGDYFDIIKELEHPDDKKMMQKAVDDYIKGRASSFEVIHRLRHKDGSWRWILTRGGILKDDKSRPYRWIGTNMDITEEQEQAQEFERFFSINLDLLSILDLEGTFIKINKAWEEVLGYSTSEIKGRSFSEFIHPDDLQITLEQMQKNKDGENINGFVNRYIGMDGTYHYIEWRSTPYKDMVYAAARDITDRIRQEKEMIEMSNRDALTNVYNRRYIFNRLSEIIEEYKKEREIFSVCILDIDFFKAVNDNYGHLAGDYILKEFAGIIEKNLRAYDILGRYGGEEFIVVLINTDKNQSAKVLNRILDTVRKKIFIFDNKEIKITFSAGISDCSEVKEKEVIIDSLIDMADGRMYQAKNTGRNRIIHKN